MTSPQLGGFIPRPAQTGEKFQANAAIGRPLIVQVIGADGARQVTGQNGTQVKKAVTVHVWDLVGGPIATDQATGQIMMGPQNTVYCNVMWMAVAVADQLGDYVGQPPFPIKLVKQKNKGNEFSSITPVALEGPELQQVQAFFAQDPTRIDREAAAKAQAAAQQQFTQPAPVQQQGGFNPMQVQPSQQQLVPTPQFQQTAAQYGLPQNGQMQAPAAAQFQQGAPGAMQNWDGSQTMHPAAAQPGPIANIPAQVAQQYAPVAQAMDQAQQLMAQGMPAPQAAQQVAQQYAPPLQATQQHVADFNQAGGQFQQPPAAAPGQPGYVQNSDVANILAGLAGGQPPQQ